MWLVRVAALLGPLPYGQDIVAVLGIVMFDQELIMMAEENIPGTLAKGLAGAHFGEKDQITWKNKAVV